MASSRRARAREEGLGEVEGGGSGPNGLGGEVSGEEGGVVSGEGVGLGNQEGAVNRPSKG